MATASVPKDYPSPADFAAAVRRPGQTLLDPVLQQGTLEPGRNGLPFMYSGGYASVFKIRADGQAYALRCWMRDIGQAAAHFRSVGDYLQRVQLPYFVAFRFMSEGIVVKGARHPTLRMTWLEGSCLRTFMGLHRSEPRVLAAAAGSFLQMCLDLHRHGMSHGDLQSDNLSVSVRQDRVEFRLLDYDTLFVPARQGVAARNEGVPAYQHPRRAESRLATKKDDYFPELVIYLSLLALAEDPRLWDDYQMADREKELVFSAADFAADQPGPLFRRLRALSPRVSRLTLILWNYTRCPDILQLPALEEAVQLADSKSAPAQGPTPAAPASFDAFLQQELARSTARPAAAAGASWLTEWKLSPTAAAGAGSTKPAPRAAASAASAAADPFDRYLEARTAGGGAPDAGSSTGSGTSPGTGGKPIQPPGQLIAVIIFALLVVLLLWLYLTH